DRAEQRLAELSDPRARAANNGKKSEAFQRALSKSAPALAKSLTPTSEKEMSKLRQSLVEAGFRSETAPVTYLALRAIVALVFLAIGGGGSLFLYGFTGAAALRTFFVAAVGFYLPILVLSQLGRRRKQQIFYGLPDALDLMVVCVEAGLGLDQAMRRVATEMKKSYRIIADEFGMCNLHLQMGRARNQVLNDLGARTGVDDLRALASILIQADKFGSSIATALRVQSDSMRVKRHQVAEEKAAKTAVKLIFPLVLFIFPGIFVVLVGPAGIQMAREMFPLMTN
ncbi:MAG: type II secretion system F family protein, partial [Planctomycetales bacterium]|nr:type II secretion system F family protein [Planctomycetales bacterium]